MAARRRINYETLILMHFSVFTQPVQNYLFRESFGAISLALFLCFPGSNYASAVISSISQDRDTLVYVALPYPPVNYSRPITINQFCGTSINNLLHMVNNDLGVTFILEMAYLAQKQQIF